MPLLRSLHLTEDVYHLEYHRAMEAEYARQHPAQLSNLTVHPEDLQAFLRLCSRYNQSPAGMFHSLLKSNA